MKNGLGHPQNIVMFGGTSDIGLAVVRRLVKATTRTVVLASRDTAAAATAAGDIGGREGTDLLHVEWDATDVGSAEAVVERVVAAAGDIDIAVIAAGILDEETDVLEDRSGIPAMAAVNFTSPMIVMAALAARMREQGYGRIILLSSVAGVRPRRSNPGYGATKAGIDGFALALDHRLEGSGADIMVVRPGFVATRMTDGMRPAPFSATADDVARAVEAAMNGSRTVVWVPGILRFVFGVLRLLPQPLWRRLPL